MYRACHYRIFGFLLLLVSYIRLQKNLSTVGHEVTTGFPYIVCVIFSFLVLSWFKIKLLLTKNGKNKLTTVGILLIHLKSHTGEKLHFSKIFLWCLGGFYPFHKNNRTRPLTNLRKILKNLLPSVIFPGGIVYFVNLNPVWEFHNYNYVLF